MSYLYLENQGLSKDDIAGSKNLIDLFHKLYPEKLIEGKKKKAAKNSY